MLQKVSSYLILDCKAWSWNQNIATPKLHVSSDPGRPLGPADFHLGRQLRAPPTNETSEEMMLPPFFKSGTSNEDLVMEEKELEGAETEARLNPQPKNGLSKLT